MKIALMAKPGEYADKIYRYLARSNDVYQASGLFSVEELATFDIGLAWFYSHILTQPQLDAVRLGIINQHPALLPHGRGAMPNVFSIAFDFPSGVTMHYM